MMASTRLRLQHEQSARAAGLQAGKTAAKAAGKTAAKPRVKPLSKPAHKTPAKPRATPLAKRAAKAPAKPRVTPLAKRAAKAPAKPTVKPAAGSAVKSAKRVPEASAKRSRKSAPAAASGSGWGVYILRCADTTLYTGCTNDRDRRLGAHGQGRVKYTRGRLPVAIAYWESSADKSAALRREAALKRLSRRAKLALCGYAKLC